MYRVDPANDVQLLPQALLDAVIALKPDFRPTHVMHPAPDSPQTAAMDRSKASVAPFSFVNSLES